MIGCFGIGRVEHDRPPYHQIRGVHQYENSLMEVESLRRHGLKVDSLVYYIKACFKWPNILLSGCDSYHHTLILSDLVYIWQQLLLFNRLSWSYHLHQLAECAYHIVNEKLRYWVWTPSWPSTVSLTADDHYDLEQLTLVIFPLHYVTERLFKSVDWWWSVLCSYVGLSRGLVKYVICCCCTYPSPILWWKN